MRRLLVCSAFAAVACGGPDAGPMMMMMVDDNKPDHKTAEGVLYLISNAAGDGANTVIGFRRAVNGSLGALPNSPFPTGGSGGPASDANQQLIASADHRFLFAVNPGSDTVAVLELDESGDLRHVSASPFESNGPNPVGLVATGGDLLFVVNQDNNPGGANASSPPSYSPFTIGETGILARVPGLRFIAEEGSSPNQAILSADGRLLFAAEELNPLLTTPLGALRSFVIADDGALLQAPGSPTSVPYAQVVAPRVVGLASHPNAQFLYASYWLRNEIAIFRYEETSAQLIFVRSISSSATAIKSMIFNGDGTRLYAASSSSGRIAVYDTTSPEMPVELQNVAVKMPKAAAGRNAAMDLRAMSFDPEQKFLYVLDNWSDEAAGVFDNSIHTFDVASDGSLTEARFSDTPLILPGNRAVGLVVL